MKDDDELMSTQPTHDDLTADIDLDPAVEVPLEEQEQQHAKQLTVDKLFIDADRQAAARAKEQAKAEKAAAKKAAAKKSTHTEEEPSTSADQKAEIEKAHRLLAKETHTEYESPFDLTPFLPTQAKAAKAKSKPQPVVEGTMHKFLRLLKLDGIALKKSNVAFGLIALVALLAMMYLFLTFSLAGHSATPQALKAEAAARTDLVVGVNSIDYPPFFYTGYDGEYAGTDYTLMKQVCDFYGWELVVTPIDWGTRNEALDAGTVDCLWDGFNPYGREESYAWTDAYQDESDVVVVLKGNKGIKTLEDLENQTVAAVPDSTASASLEHIGLAMKRMGCTDAAQCLASLKENTAQAAVMSATEAGTLKGIRVLDDKLEPRTYAVACGLKDTALRDLLNHAFTQSAK